MTTTNRPLRVFLCHSSNDKPIVRQLYRKLRAETWIQPWLDEEEVYPGQDWNMEIEKAVEAADAIIVCLSKGSITKEGYVQKEIKTALDYADYKPEGTLYIIPIRLEECTPPRRLSRWQYEDYFGNGRKQVFERLLASLKIRANSVNLKVKRPVQKEEAKSLKKKSLIKTLKQIVTLPYITLSNGMEFMRVPAGNFLMGSTKENNLANNDERPQRTIDIPYDYWMARFMVTNKQYNVFANANGFDRFKYDWGSKEDHPAVIISWKDAIGYCQWWSDPNRLMNELPSGLLLRLPTEAEWEKAARGTEGFEFPWGDTFDKDKCNTKEGGKDDTTPVGFYSPLGDSPYGCADMAGNVWEWTHSLMKNYPYKINDGREDVTFDGERVLRGGFALANAIKARCAFRYHGTYGNAGFSDIGFRMCIAPPLAK